MENTSVMALNNNWLDETSLTTTGVTAQLTTTDLPLSSYQPYYWNYPMYVTSPARPIKLTMVEVQQLQKAAKADPKLKATLAKFTALIEVTVEF